jgi:hypothetical protein
LVFKDTTQGQTTRISKLQKSLSDEDLQPLLEKNWLKFLSCIFPTTPDLTMKTILRKNTFLFTAGITRQK